MNLIRTFYNTTIAWFTGAIFQRLLGLVLDVSVIPGVPATAAICSERCNQRQDCRTRVHKPFICLGIEGDL